MKIKLIFLLFLSWSLAGCCSIPRVSTYSQLCSITKVEKKSKGGFTSMGNVVLIRDFREGEAGEDTITALKDRVEEFIAIHPELTEPEKSNLRMITVTCGATKEEVRLLLDEPDKIVKASKEIPKATELWVYSTNKASTFTVLFLPVYFGREKYFLYFNEEILTAIERHYLEQTFSMNDSGIGTTDKR